jgi:hypothetical protein
VCRSVVFFSLHHVVRIVDKLTENLRNKRIKGEKWH